MAEEPDNGQSARTVGSGQSVAFVFNETTTKWMIGLFAIIVSVCLFGVIAALVLDAINARDTGYSKAKAEYAYSTAQNASMESRVQQDKVESLRIEVAELRGKTEAKPKE